MDRYLNAPLDREEVKTLQAGDYVYITGTIYTARDAAHLRMDEALDRGEKLPIEMEGNVIYYMGPTPAREGRSIGSAGPTTASRMDKYAPRLLDLGLTGMIGKGKRKKYASDRRYRDRDGNRLTDFISIKVRGPLAERCAEFAWKGCKLAAVGDFETICFADDPDRQPGFLIKATEVEFLSPRRVEEAAMAAEEPDSADAA